MEGKDKPPRDFGSEPSPFPSKAEIERRQGLFSDYLYGRKPVPPPTTAQQALKQELEKEDAAKANLKEETKVSKKDEGKKGESYGDKLERLLTEREGRLAAQREQDKALALISAGLGIMGGKSQYASQNIGAGALKGLEQYAGARKLTSKEEEDILAGRLGQYRFGEEGRLRAEDRRLNQGMTLASLEEKRIRDEFAKILGNVLDPRNKQLKELVSRDPDYVDRMAIQGRNRILQGYGIDSGDTQPVGAAVAKDYSKWGQLNVGR
jgi:hypothetical protein